MKILSVRFANINSLKGDFEIDFTSPELAGMGIFAITGQTGSGKTTILDAITLALFGKTPRLTPGAAENELMTRGAGFCQTEVSFEAVVGGRSLCFRSFWGQHRSRNSPGGTLQPAKMQLIQVSPRLATDAWDSTKLSEVPKKVEEVTGLNFERFTRTCLLAQGQFAAFLDARPGDRAQILEQITGTEVFSKLSIAAFQRDKEANAKIDALQLELQGVTFMTDEEFAALQQRVDGLDRDRMACEEQKQVVQRHMEWVKQLTQFLENEQSLGQQQRQLAADREARATEWEKLAVGRRAEPGRVIFAQRNSLLNRSARRRVECDEVRKQFPEAEKAMADAQRQSDLVQKEQGEMQKAMVVDLELIRQVRARDQEIRNLAEIAREASRRHDSAVTNLGLADKRVKELEETIATLQRQQQNIHADLEANSCDKSLGSELKAFEQRIGLYQETSRRLIGCEREREESKTGISLAQKKLVELEKKEQSAREELRQRAEVVAECDRILGERFPGENTKTLQERFNRAQKRQMVWVSLKNLAMEWRESVAIETKVQNAIHERGEARSLAEQTLRALEIEKEHAELRCEELNELKIQLQTVASFEEHRQTLEEGHACPLCGALEHPFAHGESGISRLKKVEAEVKKERAAVKKWAGAVKEARERVSTLVAEQAADERTMAGSRSTQADLRKKWDLGVVESGGVFPLENESGINERMAAADAEIKAAEGVFEEFHALLDTREKAEKARNKAVERQQGLATDLAVARGNLDGLNALTVEVDRRVRELRSQVEELAAGLRADLLGYGFSEFDPEVLPQLKKRWEEWQELQKKLEQAIGEEHRARQNLAAAASQMASEFQRLAECREDSAKAEAVLSEARSARQAVFGEKDPVAEEKKLQAALAEQQAREERARERLQAVRVQWEKLQVTEQNLTLDMEGILRELSAEESALDQFRKRGGFPDETSFAAALLSPDELTRLSDLERVFETETQRLQGQLEGLKAQRSSHEAGRPTNRALPELAEDRERLTEAATRAFVAWQDEWKVLTTHQASREKYRSLEDRIQTTRQAGEKWSKLNSLIGSASGKKFQEFAQGLTFAGLVSQANQQLQRLSDRYLLANDGLEMRIIDRYIANARASARNLSGGEKFLASLALALGLSHMVGRKYRMDTLFIDEGFGALDPQTLETAISVLCNLQQQGKLIGVISHVESLHERLPVRLEVVRLGGGFSTITGPGCRRHHS